MKAEAAPARATLPTPYYSEPGIELYHGDCREILPLLGIRADLVMADPPYGETSLDWDRWPDRWISSLSGAIAPTCSLWCFGSLRMFFERRDDFAFWRFVQDVVWEKHNGTGFLNDRFRRVHETVAHFVRVGCKWEDIYKSPQFSFDATKRCIRRKAKPAQWQGTTGANTYVSRDGGPRLLRSVQHVRSMHGSALHPTQKPTGILHPLIQYSCPPDGLVLVPFVGSGSDLVAAKEAGRRAVGCEIIESYCDIAADRLRQGVLFSAAERGHA